MRLRERLQARLREGRRVLVVVAVEPEREALQRGLEREALQRGLERAALEQSPPSSRVVVLTGGVGPAAAAAATARELARGESGVPYGLVIAAGIAGGFAGQAEPGDTVLGTRSIAADLGADSPNGFLTVDELGFGSAVIEADPELLDALRGVLPTARVGDILTVSTVTGTDPRAAELRARYPDAVAEGMEGFGVATAAHLAGLGFVELRTVSNAIGARNRGAWRIADALAALATTGAALASLDP